MNAFARKMKQMGFALCDSCDYWCNDVKPCVRETTVEWRGAPQDVPVRVGNLCTDCRDGAVPEEEF